MESLNPGVKSVDDMFASMGPGTHADLMREIITGLRENRHPSVADSDVGMMVNIYAHEGAIYALADGFFHLPTMARRDAVALDLISLLGDYAQQAVSFREFSDATTAMSQVARKTGMLNQINAIVRSYRESSPFADAYITVSSRR